ncbi:MAG: GtrA family protein [Bacteroidaceae bacterium]
MEWIRSIFGRFRNLILYGVIGSLTSMLDFAVFTVLTSCLGVYYLLANCLSVLVGISTSFVLNRSYNFKVKDKTKRRFLIFLSVGLSGLCMSNLILWIGIDKLQANEQLTKLASIVLVVFFQFLLNKYITFKVTR